MLRPYQQAILDGLHGSLAEHDRVLAVSPTGSGKSWLIAHMLDEIEAAHQSALVLVHRREIIYQLRDHLDARGTDHGIILAGERPRLIPRIQIGSIQSFVARYIRGKRQPPPANWLIIDEAHLSLAPSYHKVLDLYPGAKLLGFTATPCRGDGRGLGNIYTDMVERADIEGLIEAGYLVPTRVMAPSIPDLTGVRVRLGDYVPGEVEELMDNKTLVGDAVRHWLDHARGRKTVCFTSGVSHSLHVCEEFRRAGIQAEHLDGNTDKQHREKILHQLTHGDLQVVTNCEVLTTGWDAPCVSCMVMMRPTKSYGLYLQMAGRILRPYPGKQDALILDHGGNVYRHGFPEDAGNWSLDPDERIQDRREREKKERQPTTCRNCWTVYTGRRDCPECGWVPTPQARAADIKEGRLQEVKRKGKPKADKEKVWRDCLWKARYRNMKVGAAAHMYKKELGVWPRGMGNLQPRGEQWQWQAGKFIERSWL